MATDESDQQNNVPSSLKANYVVETYTYFIPNRILTSNTHDCDENDDDEDDCLLQPLNVYVKSATTTIGVPIVVANEYDATGIMIWPATHLLCQYLCSSLMTKRSKETTASTTMNIPAESSQLSAPSLGNTVLELGCGCGLVGVTAALLAAQQDRSSTKSACPHQTNLWVSTDMDTQALRLTSENFQLNQPVTTEADELRGEGTEITSEQGNLCIWVRRLQWGNEEHIHRLLRELSEWKQHGIINQGGQESSNENINAFDSIVAADIVYPATCDHVLQDLLGTVGQLLAPQGTFWLSFCSRDGPKTPSQLIDAASKAGFSIHAMPSLPKSIQSQLPPLLDAKLLILQRSATALLHNRALGQDEDCTVFPGLRATMARREEAMTLNETETWEAPFSGEDEEFNNNCR